MQSANVRHTEPAEPPSTAMLALPHATVTWETPRHRSAPLSPPQDSSPRRCPSLSRAPLSQLGTHALQVTVLHLGDTAYGMSLLCTPRTEGPWNKDEWLGHCWSSPVLARAGLCDTVLGGSGAQATTRHGRGARPVCLCFLRPQRLLLGSPHRS